METMNVSVTLQFEMPMVVPGEWETEKEYIGGEGVRDNTYFVPDIEAVNEYMKTVIDKRFPDCKNIEFEINEIG